MASNFFFTEMNFHSDQTYSLSFYKHFSNTYLSIISSKDSVLIKVDKVN